MSLGRDTLGDAREQWVVQLDRVDPEAIFMAQRVELKRRGWTALV
jgi:hypothetical protein